jgi:hypothetical protein
VRLPFVQMDCIFLLLGPGGVGNSIPIVGSIIVNDHDDISRARCSLVSFPLLSEAMMINIFSVQGFSWTTACPRSPSQASLDFSADAKGPGARHSLAPHSARQLRQSPSP